MLDLLLNAWPLLLVAVLLFAMFGLGRVLLPDEQPPYEKRPSLVTDAEHRFFRALIDAGQQRWTICPMVRLADVIRVRPQAVQAQTWQGRILAKHLDFVLCDPATLEARLAIELDDATHERPERQARDEFLSAALAASKLPLLRVPVAERYDTEQLRAAIEQRLGLTSKRA